MKLFFLFVYFVICYPFASFGTEEETGCAAISDASIDIPSGIEEPPESPEGSDTEGR